MIKGNQQKKWWRDTVSYSRSPFLASLLIASGDALGLLFSAGRVSTSTLVLVLFLEGGVGLLLGVVISLSSTPSASTVGETLLGTASWSQDAERHAEKVGWKWMLASCFLVLIGFLVSFV